MAFQELELEPNEPDLSSEEALLEVLDREGKPTEAEPLVVDQGAGPLEWTDPNFPPPRDAPKQVQAKWWYQKRQRERDEQKGRIERLEQTIQQLATQGQMRPPVPQVAVQPEPDGFEEFATRHNLDPNAKVIFRELAKVIAQQTNKQYVDPVARVFFKGEVTREEKDLLKDYQDPETGYQALKPMVWQHAQEQGVSLATAYAVVSRPLAEQKMARMSGSSREQTVDAKKRMSDGVGRGGGSGQIAGEITLSAQQKAHAERTWPDMKPSEAHKKFAESFKKSRYARTYDLPGDKIEDILA